MRDYQQLPDNPNDFLALQSNHSSYSMIGEGLPRSFRTPLGLIRQEEVGEGCQNRSLYFSEAEISLGTLKF